MGNDMRTVLVKMVSDELVEVMGIANKMIRRDPILYVRLEGNGIQYEADYCETVVRVNIGKMYTVELVNENLGLKAEIGKFPHATEAVEEAMKLARMICGR